MTGRRRWRRPICAIGGGAAKTVMTVHNLAFQGQFPASIFGVARPAGRGLRASTASSIMAASAT